ncbi:MAG: DEAD/DEAH box helicase [Candidatus Auribacterota bacterium]|jgi:ATP-dependent RNA helicase DeaD|nr:DEAD/DEAH box helicase [Candidatus Auribacterota bacterium]
MDSFADLSLSQQMLQTLKNKGFELPTPIQQKTIRAMFELDKDIVGQAQTGTGKTAAFGIPIIEMLQEHTGHTQALVLTPTRELAIQVAEELQSLKGKKNLKIAPIYGGQAIGLQFRSLEKGLDIVVGTPGRVIDHINRGTLKLGKIRYFVLDEADEMLNMGFIEEVQAVIEATPTDKRTMLFSATMPREIEMIARRYLGDYETLKVTPEQLTIAQTDQIYFVVNESDKFEALCRIIDIEDDFYGLVFCRTKIDVDKVAHHLMDRGYDAEALHGDMSQSHREKILLKFKRRFFNIVVATDVAARGIDVQDLTHVINYSLPQCPESYVHRIGRTGRAGKEGNAVTFITPLEYHKLDFISRKTKTDIRKAILPGVDDIINTKKAKIKKLLAAIIGSKPGPTYSDMAKELLEENDPAAVLAAFLQYSFSHQLDEGRYAHIKDVSVEKREKSYFRPGKGRHERSSSSRHNSKKKPAPGPSHHKTAKKKKKS